MMNELHTQNAVQNEKIGHLTEEVRLHNNFARRMPVVEEKVDALTKQVDAQEGRIDALMRIARKEEA